MTRRGNDQQGTQSRSRYSHPDEFESGTIETVGVTVEYKQYLDLERLAAAAMALD